MSVFRIPIGQESIQVVGDPQSMVIDQILNELAQWKGRFVNLEDHLNQRI